MKYTSGKQFLDDPHKKVVFIGLSGVGKTTASRMLPDNQWFHYSVDYRIWTHHLGDQLNDYLKQLALEQPILKGLLLKDAISVEHRLHFDNLFATSVYMGMLGDVGLGGSSVADFKERMALYSDAEVAAMLDIPKFIKRAESLYRYPNFLVDASGSLCDVIDLDSSEDRTIDYLEKECLVIYIKSTEEHNAELVRRASIDPKPIYYRPEFIDEQLPKLLDRFKVDNVEEIPPQDVNRYLYPHLIKARTRRYDLLADKIGYKVSMSDWTELKSADQVLRIISTTIDSQNSSNT
jgi:GTPase SAR1 family protein